MNRRLTLKAELLAELTPLDLATIAGGPDQPTKACPSVGCTSHWPYATLERPCDSVQPCIAVAQTPLCPNTR